MVKDLLRGRRQESGVRRKKVNISPQSPVTRHQYPVPSYQEQKPA
ncbi:MAG: hypothetical protein ACKPEO_16540 [Sphaerospermopsis kisseleviana]